MRIRRMALAAMFCGILSFVAGCDNEPESAQTFEMGVQQVNGTNLRLLSVTSGRYYFSEKQSEIRPRLETIINSGKYNIVSVKT